MEGKPNTGSENIQSEYRDGFRHRKMCHAYNEKRKTTDDERNKLPNQGKIRMLGEREKYLGILEADTFKKVETKEKIKRSISGGQETYSKPKYIGGTLSKG